MKNRPSIVAVVVLTAFLLWPSAVDAQDRRIFPQDMTQWDSRQWQQMTNSEQWMFLAGMALASWVYGHTVTTALDDPETATREEILSRLYVLEDFLEQTVDDTHRQLKRYYRHGGTMPLWQSPYRIQSLINDKGETQ